LRIVATAAAPHAGRRYARIGFGPGATIAPGARALLTQQVRNPRAGRYVLTLRARGGGASPRAYRDLFLAHFACRLIVFGYNDLAKDPTRVREFATLALQVPYVEPAAADSPQFVLETVLKSQDDGALQL